MKKLAIMQPYLLPYMGYWQLLNAVDEFVIYDNIQYTKKGWINRNRFLLNDKDELFSIPLKADSDYLNVVDRFIADAFDHKKLVSQLRNAYRKAPHFDENFHVIEEILLFSEQNLFRYVLHSVEKIAEYLNIQTRLVVSSTVPIDHDSLKGQDKVLALCAAQKATAYYNPPGGMELYDEESFKEQGFDLKFIKPKTIQYPQFGWDFVPNLSIVDVLMFNSREKAAGFLHEYDMVAKESKRVA